jgi:5,10-methylenetetrahydromethanopterin reductase
MQPVSDPARRLCVVQVTLMSYIGDGGGRPVLDTYIETLARLRDEGFRRLWSPQLPTEPDLLTLLAVALREVEVIEVGSAVLPIQVQHPSQLAQRALVVNQIAGGRLKLGLGVHHSGLTEEQWGISFDKPVRLMREYLDGLQPLLAGAPAAAVGDMLTTRVTLQIPGAPPPDVYLAALGPQMLRLAGRRTAGTITWMTGPKTLAEHIGPTLREAAEAAGRPPGAVRVVAPLPVCVTDDVDGARVAAAEQFELYGQLPSYRAMLDREGFTGPEDAVLIGDEATVSDRIAELRNAGVDEYAGFPFGNSAEDAARTRALLRELDPTD